MEKSGSNIKKKVIDPQKNLPSRATAPIRN